MVPAPEVRSFRQLLVWELSVRLVIDVYSAVRVLPHAERFELGRELRRSAISIPSNIAEGFNRHSRAVYRSHVAIALGSTAELETQIELGARLAYFDASQSRALLDATNEVGRLLQGLWRSLKRGKAQYYADEASAHR
jgi:four helix bundle protein